MLRKHFNATTVIAIVALVFAMTGGAFAVTSKGGGGNATIAAKKKSKAKVLRGPAGPKGATGVQGPAGAVGPTGPQGPAGAKGENGTAGAEGKEGKAGTSVTATGFASSKGPCKEGGSEFKVGTGTSTYACNGKEGATGKEGSPWTAGGTLPKGATETGTWAVSAVGVGYELHNSVFAPISFPVPLAGSLSAEHVHVVAFGVKAATGTGDLEENSSVVKKVSVATGEFTLGAEISGTGIAAGTTIAACSPSCESAIELTLSAKATVKGTVTGVTLTAGSPPACKGTVETPEAESGNLCVFESRKRETTFEFGSNVKEGFVRRPTAGFSEEGTGRTGAMVWLWSAESTERIDQFGTWAVTG